MKIRAAAIEDCSECARIYNQNLGTASMYLTPRSSDYFVEIFKSLSARESMKIITHDNTILGFSLIQKYSPKEGYRYACETSTYLDKIHQGKGIGSQFKKHVIEECKQLGYKYIVARIVSSNAGSIHYNIKLGYRIVGIQKGIGNFNGKPIDVTIMEYHIT
jgi:phosphinothricin acetyltransferase